MSDPNDPAWEWLLEKAKEQLAYICRRMVAKEQPNGNILQYRCKKKAKYIATIKGEEFNLPFQVCIEHANELRSRLDVTIIPLNPKLIVMT